MTSVYTAATFSLHLFFISKINHVSWFLIIDQYYLEKNPMFEKNYIPWEKFSVTGTEKKPDKLLRFTVLSVMGNIFH